MSQTNLRQFPSLSETEMSRLSEQVITAARRMSNDQILDLADGLHDILRARHALSRRRQAEPMSFAATR